MCLVGIGHCHCKIAQRIKMYQNILYLDTQHGLLVRPLLGLIQIRNERVEAQSANVTALLVWFNNKRTTVVGGVLNSKLCVIRVR